MVGWAEVGWEVAETAAAGSGEAPTVVATAAATAAVGSVVAATDGSYDYDGGEGWGLRRIHT